MNHPQRPRLSRLWRRLRWPEIVAVTSTAILITLVATGFTDRILTWMW